MKLKGHLFWTGIYMGVIMMFIEPLALILIFLIAWISLLPDIDLRLYRESHRFFPFHSIIIPLIAFYLYPNILTLMILLSIGHHLALDTVGNLIFGKEGKGYYTICLIPSYIFNFLFFKLTTKGLRISGKSTTVWLLLNWILSIIIAIWWLIL